MIPSSRTPEGEPNRCPICGKTVVVEPSLTGDAPCPHCGSLLWFRPGGDVFGLPVLTLAADVAQSKRQVIQSILRAMADRGQFRLEDCESIAQTILKRESLGSTGIGRGVAIPHATHPRVPRLVGVVAKVPDGVDFDSLDGAPVHTICLLVAPIDRPGDHLRALEDMSRWLREQS